MIKDFFNFSLNNLKHRRLRTWLTMLGIFIGIAAVVALISLGQGMQKAIEKQFEELGSDKITIMSSMGGLASPAVSALSANPIIEEDLKIIKKVDGVKLAAGILMSTADVEFKAKKKGILIWGTPVDETKKIVEEMQGYKIENGRNLKSSDTNKAVIGSYVADGLFDKKIDVGDKISIKDKSFTIVGILESVGNRIDDGAISIPLDYARDIFDEENLISMMIIQVDKGLNATKVAESIEKNLRDHRNENEGEEDFVVSTSEQILSIFNTVFSVVQAVLIGIAAISLLVGGIGIMNTMYTAVLERTREIGVMKAIGAKNSDVMLIFLIESGMLGLVGGLIGILIGIGISKTVEIIASKFIGGLLKAYFPWYLIAGALIFSFLIGTISGVMPAIQASKMKPVDALRYE